ncbi:MAG: hypothetical protein JXR37_00610 [Kiritimatiellae bacterium]|nr:hypothetical protein [Kiritimatiellia bacterium]
MHLTPIRVECYAGHKAGESPRRFCLGARCVEIEEILDRWYQGARDPEWPIADYFKVRTAEGAVCLLRHDRESDEWAIVGEDP